MFRRILNNNNLKYIFILLNVNNFQIWKFPAFILNYARIVGFVLRVAVLLKALLVARLFCRIHDNLINNK